MSTDKISLEDVIKVAASLNKKLKDFEIKWILDNYDSHKKDDPTSTWDLIIENMIYNLPTDTYNFNFDQKVTTWMRTHIEVEAIDEEHAKKLVLKKIKNGDVESLPWEQIEGIIEVM